MLPFLKNKDRQAGSIVHKYRSPDGSIKATPEYSRNDGLEACALDLMKAVKAEDIKGIASSLKAAFELLDSMPHEEDSHINEDDQNE